MYLIPDAAVPFIEEAVLKETPERDGASDASLVTTFIHTSAVVPCVTSRLLVSLEGRVEVEGAVGGERDGVVNVEGVAICGDTEHDLVREASGSPLRDAARCTALLVLLGGA